MGSNPSRPTKRKMKMSSRQFKDRHCAKQFDKKMLARKVKCDICGNKVPVGNIYITGKKLIGECCWEEVDG